MRLVAARNFALASIVLLAVAGCKTDGSFDWAAPNTQNNQAAAWDQPPAPAAGPDVTGTVNQQPPAPDSDTPVYAGPANNSPAGEVLLGNNPADDLKLGKKHYREKNFGLAERYFRRSVEANPRNAEGWMGLAASYDRLRRFDLADRAYGQALRIIGPVPELLNNQGYSYILRGDYKKARVKLMAAKAKDPNNRYIQSNIDLLEDSVRNAK